MTTEPLSRVYEQIDLFSQLEKATALPHNSEPTSVLAALQAIPKVKADKLAILEELERRDTWVRRGLIQDEACAYFGWETGTCNPRFWELHDAKLIDTTLETRDTRSRKAARVYVITDAGRDVLRSPDPAGQLGRPRRRPAHRGQSSGRDERTNGGQLIEDE